ncbi:hypothetical protein SAMN05444339_11136 [Loktanella atrilutea]|uniref:Uncharacterized protein n=1 Tax=Loktanella atrilutea TaxID=366533 RepID=A0A1M5E1W2_LOKAT|nr:hypothetical protein [Loktanella atrilutea]SHF73166.1 hypothetical protein SAMN05444339_11136 [Loktanella atrilutea]
MLSGLVEHVEEISKLENRFKSTQQMRLWRNDRKHGELPDLFNQNGVPIQMMFRAHDGKNYVRVVSNKVVDIRNFTLLIACCGSTFGSSWITVCLRGS